MNSIIFSLVFVPIVEIYLLIKIGSQIGAIFTIFLILMTAVVGIYYAKYEGLNTLKSGFLQLSKNQTPTFEVVSGAAIAFGAILLIIPGFVTDFFGFLLIFPVSRRIIFNKLFINFPNTKKTEKNNFIDGEFEDIESDDDKKI